MRQSSAGYHAQPEHLTASLGVSPVVLFIVWCTAVNVAGLVGLGALAYGMVTK